MSVKLYFNGNKDKSIRIMNRGRKNSVLRLSKEEYHQLRPKLPKRSILIHFRFGTSTLVDSDIAYYILNNKKEYIQVDNQNKPLETKEITAFKKLDYMRKLKEIKLLNNKLFEFGIPKKKLSKVKVAEMLPIYKKLVSELEIVRRCKAKEKEEIAENRIKKLIDSKVDDLIDILTDLNYQLMGKKLEPCSITSEKDILLENIFKAEKMLENSKKTAKGSKK